MKERPILFSGPMVRAILEGRKTQTRRVIVWPLLSASNGSTRRRLTVSDADELKKMLAEKSNHPHCRFCLYGRPGNRLWVRETWAPCAGGVIYRADAKDSLRAGIAAEHDSDTGRWHPSIHMPRWASRMTLEITAVRVERLQDISEADAIAEGIERTLAGWESYDGLPPLKSPVNSYKTLWEAINGKVRPGKPDVSWAANPWVWVVEFKRITP